jgi:hypothetical protein
METNGLTQVGGLLKEAFTSSLNGFDDLGADYIDTHIRSNWWFC